MFVLKSTYQKIADRLSTARAREAQLERQLVATVNKNVELIGALQTIIAQETVAPNATVTRILNTAKEALGLGSRA